MITFQKATNNKGPLPFHFCKQASIIFCSRMNVEESFVEKLQRQSKERLKKLREEKEERQKAQ
jgi:hypothetical protein